MIQIETFEADTLPELRDKINAALSGRHRAVSTVGIHIGSARALAIVQPSNPLMGGAPTWGDKFVWYGWIELSSVRGDLVRPAGEYDEAEHGRGNVGPLGES